MPPTPALGPDTDHLPDPNLSRHSPTDAVEIVSSQPIRPIRPIRRKPTATGRKPGTLSDRLRCRDTHSALIMSTANSIPPIPGHDSGLQPFAWAGWTLRVPGDWRPLDIIGEWKHGKIVLGDSDQALLRVRWERSRAAGIDGEQWRRVRLRKLGGQPAPAAETDLMPQGFIHTGLLLNPTENAADAEWVWAGCAPKPGLIIEVSLNGAAPVELKTTATRRVLPSLRAVPPDRPVPWAIFDTSFRSPPGFVLTDKRLHLGDAALLLERHGRDRVMLRQVYPAQLALTRCDMLKWLRVRPFASNRRRRPAAPPTKWELDLGKENAHGFIEEGWTRLPAPLGTWRPRRYAAAVVHATESDRLLIAEIEVRTGKPRPVLEQALRDMNWSHQTGQRPEA